MKDKSAQESWFREYLLPGETVRWTGRPGKRIGFQPIYLFFGPFMTVWCGGVISATVAEILNFIDGNGELFLLFFFIPFWAGGAFFVYILFILPLMRRKLTRYAVTDMRVLEYYRGTVNSVSIEPHTSIMMTKVSKHGTASVTVGASYDDPRMQVRQLGTFHPEQLYGTPGMITMRDIDEPAKVYSLITNRTGL